MSEATHHVLADIEAERFRQMSAEGWTPAHDDSHKSGELARAAACYAFEASRSDDERIVHMKARPLMWPWAGGWWKPTDRRLDLIKAAALIVAEIERLDRAQANSPKQGASA